MKQLEVQIMGQSYLLGSPEGGDERLLHAVARVDDAMCKIRDAGKIKARERIAVLAALNLAFDLGDRQHASSAGATTLQAGEPTYDPTMDTLIARLDAALGEDGRLI